MRLLRLFKEISSQIILIPEVESVSIEGENIKIITKNKEFFNKFPRNIHGFSVLIELEKEKTLSEKEKTLDIPPISDKIK